MRESGELLARHGGVEAGDAVVRGVDLEQHRAFFRYRGLVVAQVRAVRRADLDHLRARERHDVRYAEGAAYLDELSARDDGFLVLRERREGEDDRRGVVVDGERRLRAGEAAEKPFDVVVALSALAAVERVFERVVGARDFVDRLDGLAREQRAAEVRVYHDAGRVDDAAQAVLRAAREQAARVRGDCVRVEGRVAVFDYLRALGREQVGEQRLHRLASEPLLKFRYPRKREQLVHRRDVSHYFLYLCVQGNSSLNLCSLRIVYEIFENAGRAAQFCARTLDTQSTPLRGRTVD